MFLLSLTPSSPNCYSITNLESQTKLATNRNIFSSTLAFISSLQIYKTTENLRVAYLYFVRSNCKYFSIANIAIPT